LATTSDEDDMPLTNRGFKTGIPIWVKVPVVIALVLAGVVISTMLLGSASDGGHGPGGDGGHGSDGGMEMDGHRGGQGGHGSGGRMEMRDHNGPHER
jgi:hypothetical protein